MFEEIFDFLRANEDKVLYFENYSVMIQTIIFLVLMFQDVFEIINQWIKKKKYFQIFSFLMLSTILTLYILFNYIEPIVLTQGHHLQTISYFKQAYEIEHKRIAQYVHFSHGLFLGSLIFLFHRFIKNYYVIGKLIVILFSIVLSLYIVKFLQDDLKIGKYSIAFIILFFINYHLLYQMLYPSSLLINTAILFIMISSLFRKKKILHLVSIFILINTRYVMLIFVIYLIYLFLTYIKTKDLIGSIALLSLLFLNLHLMYIILFSDTPLPTSPSFKELWHKNKFISSIISLTDSINFLIPRSKYTINIAMWFIFVILTGIITFLILKILKGNKNDKKDFIGLIKQKSSKKREIITLKELQQISMIIISMLGLIIIYPFHFRFDNKYYHLTYGSIMFILVLLIFYVIYLLQSKKIIHLKIKKKEINILNLFAWFFLIYLIYIFISNSIFAPKYLGRYRDWIDYEKSHGNVIKSLLKYIDKNKINREMYFFGCDRMFLSYVDYYFQVFENFKVLKIDYEKINLDKLNKTIKILFFSNELLEYNFCYKKTVQKLKESSKFDSFEANEFIIFVRKNAN